MGVQLYLIQTSHILKTDQHSVGSIHRRDAIAHVTLLMHALNKIVEDKAVGVVVFPAWSSQPWYPLLTRLCTGATLVFTSYNEAANHLEKKAAWNCVIKLVNPDFKEKLTAETNKVGKYW